MLRHIRHSLTHSLGKNLVETFLVFLLFDSAYALYHDLVDVTQELRVNRLMNACVRFIQGNIPWRSHVAPYRVGLDWRFPKSRRELCILGSLAFPTLVHHNASLPSRQVHPHGPIKCSHVKSTTKANIFLPNLAD